MFAEQGTKRAAEVLCIKCKKFDIPGQKKIILTNSVSDSFSAFFKIPVVLNDEMCSNCRSIYYKNRSEKKIQKAPSVTTRKVDSLKEP